MSKQAHRAPAVTPRVVHVEPETVLKEKPVEKAPVKKADKSEKTPSDK